MSLLRFIDDDDRHRRRALNQIRAAIAPIPDPGKTILTKAIPRSSSISSCDHLSRIIRHGGSRPPSGADRCSERTPRWPVFRAGLCRNDRFANAAFMKTRVGAGVRERRRRRLNPRAGTVKTTSTTHTDGIC